MDKLLTIEQAAPLLHVHTKTLSKWCLERRIPATKFGRRWLINPKVIDKITSDGYSHKTKEDVKWQSSSVAKSITSGSQATDKAYIDLLERQ